MSNEMDVRSFCVDVPDEAVADLRRRVAATRWPDRETVGDRSQGAQLAKIQELVRYWGTDYDWRKVEAKLNALPQFMTGIDGLDIHFIHVRSSHQDALPLIMTHGWPGSVLELVKVIGPLTDPTAHGGRAEDAFDLVLPSMPGYGFSARPTSAGWGPDRIAHAWAELMGRLGYQRYVSQGGDWGSVVSDVMARQAPAGLLGIHVNMPATVPPEIAKALQDGDPAPPGTATSSARLYWDNNANNFNAVDISLPAAVTVFPGEIYRAPRSWAERAYHNLIYFNEVDKGGHFAAWEQPDLFAAEMRAAFRSLR
jgi:pimeloyl-ACP methyl ester carboxylesterase